MKPTIADIAVRAGVTKAAVSFALARGGSGSPSWSPEGKAGPALGGAAVGKPPREDYFASRSSSLAPSAE
jgi:hypothetical protein